MHIYISALHTQARGLNSVNNLALIVTGKLFSHPNFPYFESKFTAISLKFIPCEFHLN